MAPGDIDSLGTDGVKALSLALIEQNRLLAEQNRSLTSLHADLVEIRKDLDELHSMFANISGFRQEIDHALERIAAIERHLGISRRIAA